MDVTTFPAWALAAFVFAARVGDMSLATVRTIMIFRGRRALAAGIGFFEILIWLSAVGVVPPHIDRWYLVLA